ncbi:MAG: S8 family serine peptidase, partial [Nitrosopumilus sp.]|nr:S8 family serine peptidase [Nitrosopumilus sp.]
MVGRSGIAVALALAAVSALSGHASAQSPDSGIAAEPVVPSADEVAAAKFDPGFYDKVRAITDAQAQGGTGDARYYDVLIIVSRDNGDGVDPDQTAARNKRAVAEELESMGARDIIQGGSLSFVAASVPVHMIEQVSMMGEVYKLGDGEAEIELALDTSKATTSSTSKSIDAVPGAAGLNGSGVVVSAIERSMYNPHVFDGQVIEHIGCNIGIEYRCNVSAGNIHVRSGFGGEHGVQVAQIIGASGLPEGNGVAPGVKFINVNVNLRHYLNVAIILDMLVQRGVDLVNMSFSSTKPISACDPYYSPTYSLLANEAVDRGVVVVVSAGNGGSSLGFAEYGTVFAPGCAHNVITVGGISDRGSDITVYESTSRGPTADGRLKPEIVAPAHNLRLLVGSESTKMADRISGTSFAAPQVVGAAALLLQANPDLTPAEVKAALLLGAAWTGPSGCTSLKYEAEDPSSGCSHARQVRDLNRASSAHEGLQMLNNVGLGILNTSDAVRYVLDPAHVRPGYLGSSADESRYHFTVTDTNKQAKIILTWMAHPHGGIDDRVPTFLPKAPFPGSNGIINSNPTNVADLDFVTLDPDGRPVAAASGVSAWQNVEFAVFEPARAGTYTIIVNGTHIEDTNKLGQRFALASTHQLDSMRPSNEPPVAGDIDVVVQQGVPRKILLTGDDEDGDPVSFRISKEPENGLVSKADPVGRSSAYVLYEASGPGADSFEVTPYDEFGDGAPATITLVPESLPPNARSSDGAMRIITDTDVLSTRAESARGGYSETFPGKAYPVSRLQLASSHLIEPVANVSIGSDTYTIAIPDDGFRRVTFGSPVVIDSVTLYAKGVDVGFSQKKKANPLAEGSAQAHVGYKSVPTKDEATPDIYLLGPNPHYVKAGGPRSFYHSVDPGAICLDDADPDRTVKQSRDIPLSKAGSFKVTYRCTDDRNNSNETTRRVIVDDKPPRKPVGINVKKNLSLDLGDPFTPSQTARCRQDSGTRVALDVYVIGIDGRTKIDALDTSKSGRYKVVYECRDRAGHASSIEQVVVVGLDMGPPRFMHFLKSSTPNYCTVDLARGLGPISSIDGSIWYTPDGLVARVPFYNNSDYPHPASVEINSLDTDKTIVVYNFERTRVTDDIYMATVTVPPEALSVISGDIENDGFNANVVYSKRSIRPSNFAIPADKTFATSITHPGVDIEEFETFRHKSLYTHLTPNGVDKIVKFENGVLTEVPYILHGVSSSDKCYYPYGETLNLNDLGTPGIAEMPSLVHLQPGSGEHRSACTGSVPKVVRNDTFRSTNEEVYTIRYTCTNGLRDSEPIDVTYVIDGTLPVVSVTQPDPHYVQPVLGGRYMDVDPMATCTDVSPGSVRSVTSDADHASISSDSSFTVTYTCADMAGNFRTAERLVVVDGTDPGEPAGVAPVSLEAGQPFNRGPITCPKDSGSPVDLVNTTTVRNTGEVIQIIDASIPGSYDIEYKCRDRAGNESKGRGQSVDITEVLEPGRGSDPEITGTEVIHFRQGTEPPAHGLTCADGAADLTSTITGDIAVDSTTPDGNATVTYTCTDELESKTVTHEVTYIVDGTPPVISPATGTIQLELGGTFTPETVTCTDPYPKASISNIDRAGRPAVEAALLSKAESSPQVTYDCKDAVDNHAVQSVRTFQILDTTPPAAPSVSAPAVDVPEGAVLDLGDVICAQDGGTPITLRNTTTLDNAPYTGPITTSTPGTYEITYACRDANQAGDPATQTVTVNPAPGRGSDPEITGTEVIHFR